MALHNKCFLLFTLTVHCRSARGALDVTVTLGPKRALSQYTHPQSQQKREENGLNYMLVDVSAQSVTSAHISLAKVRLTATTNFYKLRGRESTHAQKAESQNCFVNSPYHRRRWSLPGSSGGTMDVF